MLLLPLGSSSSSLWSKQVPKEIMQLIVQRLGVSDWVRCGAVCRSWQAMIKSMQCRPAPELAWLMLCYHPSAGRDYWFLSLSDGKVHKITSPSNPFYNKRKCLTCFGRLNWRMVDYGARVTLPSSKYYCECVEGCTTVKLVASSGPTGNGERSQHQQQPPPPPPCFVVRLCSTGRLEFCMINDISWTSIDEEEELLFYDRLTDTGYISLAQDSASVELFMIVREASYVTGPFNLFPRITFHNYVNPPKTKGFRVLKLEFNNTPPWVEVVDLGDRTLFVSEIGNQFISTTTTNNINGNHGRGERLERNCIYFAFDYYCVESPSSKHDFGVFSLTDKTIRRFDFSQSFSSDRSSIRPVWFTPNP
ncbi:hypothetical protein GBA52_001855 [Prunus armeniaca]|nr:hypothetical protein GBA52_001855 [Prunus armeniaca]